MTLMQNTTKSGAVVEYHCSLGKAFEFPHGTENKIRMECLWDGTWSPSGDLQECVCE